MFTDIEGSTRLLQELGSELYGTELERHRERVRRAITAHAGVLLGIEGDAFFIAFTRASDALSAASEMQAALADGPIRVRIGIHTGERGAPARRDPGAGDPARARPFAPVNDRHLPGGINTEEIISTLHARQAPMMHASAGLAL